MRAQVDFIFDETAPTIENLGRSLIELDQLCRFIFYLTLGSDDPRAEGRLLESLVVDPFYNKLAILSRAASHDLRDDPFRGSLVVQHIRYASPLLIEAITSTKRRLGLHLPHVRRILDLLGRLVTIDLIRERAQWSNELIRQKAIEAALKNHERVLDVSEKIRNPDLRDEFIRNFALAIVPLIHQRGKPNLRRVDINELPD